MLAATTILGVSYVYVRRFLSPYNLPPLALATCKQALRCWCFCQSPIEPE
jgi:hypothetical protein